MADIGAVEAPVAGTRVAAPDSAATAAVVVVIARNKISGLGGLLAAFFRPERWALKLFGF